MTNRIEVNGVQYVDSAPGLVARVLQPLGEAPLLGGAHPEVAVVPVDPWAGLTPEAYHKLGASSLSVKGEIDG